MTELAFLLLPAWQKKIWAQQKEKLISTYSNYPDTFAGPDTETKDRVDPDWRNFFPDENVLHLTLPPAREKFLSNMTFFFSGAIRNLKKGSYQDAAKYAGIISHIIGDAAQPIHNINYSLLLDLLPPPKEFLHVDMHARTERGLKISPARLNFSGYEPELLGLDIRQVLMNFWVRYNALVKSAQSAIVPVIQAVYSHKEEKARRRTISSYKEAIPLIADSLLTCISLASGKTTKSQKKKLSTFDLRELEPEPTSYFGVYHQNARLVKDANIDYFSSNMYRPVPLSLLINGKAKRFEKGIGVLPWMGKSRIDYVLVPGVYRKFTCLCGLNAGIGQKGCVRFKVIVDGKTLFNSGIVDGNKPVRKVSANIADATELSLLAEEKQKKAADFIYNHSVWAEPRLLR